MAASEGIYTNVTRLPLFCHEGFLPSGRRHSRARILINPTTRRTMKVRKYLLWTMAVGFGLTIAALPVRAESANESDRLEKLEKAVQALQERNAQLEAEVKK